jgi:hypothetical protein
MRLANAARKMSLSRPQRTVKCETCGDTFNTISPVAKYCGNSCRCLAYQRRKKAK